VERGTSIIVSAVSGIWRIICQLFSNYLPIRGSVSVETKYDIRP
jgi:hypothetical protein